MTHYLNSVFLLAIIVSLLIRVISVSSYKKIKKVAALKPLKLAAFFFIEFITWCCMALAIVTIW